MRFYRRRWHTRRRAGARRLFRRAGFTLFLIILFILFLDLCVHPILREVAEAQLENRISLLISSTVAGVEADDGVTYDALVTEEKNDAGAITALQSNMTAVNSLRDDLIRALSGAVGSLDMHDLDIPLGNLTGVDFFSGRGPEIQVRAVWIGTVTAEFESEFTAAGINQTQHKIYVDVTVPISVLLPTGLVKTQVESRVCVAENVIVGNVPDTYLQLGTEQDNGQ